MIKNIINFFVILFGIAIINGQVGINMQSPEAIFHIDGKANTLSGSVGAYYDDVLVDASGRLGIGNKTPMTRLDLRSDERLNAIGIGGTLQTASAANAGAIRYNASTSDLSYSNGTNWINLAHKTPNDFVNAENTSGQSFSNNIETTIVNWTTHDDSNGSFDPQNGVFTASKTGIYIVSFTFSLANGTLTTDARYEAAVKTNSTSASTNKIFKCVGSYPGANTLSNKVAGGCSGIFNLNSGDKVTVTLLQNLSLSKSLDAEGTYTSLSIFGL